MGRETDRIQEVVDLLAGLGDRMPDHRAKKVSTLYRLASRIGNTVVELGTYHGTGAIALALGVQAYGKGHVWTVDDYVQKRGWAGESYRPSDKRIFEKRVKAAGLADAISLVQKPSLQAAEEWTGGRINLLFWDFGILGRLREDFAVWVPHLTIGGTFAVHDTGNGQFGSFALAEQLKAGGGWIDAGTMAGDVHCMIKARMTGERM